VPNVELIAALLVAAGVTAVEFASDQARFDVPESVIGFLRGELGDPPGELSVRRSRGNGNASGATGKAGGGKVLRSRRNASHGACTEDLLVASREQELLLRGNDQ